MSLLPSLICWPPGSRFSSHRYCYFWEIESNDSKTTWQQVTRWYFFFQQLYGGIIVILILILRSLKWPLGGGSQNWSTGKPFPSPGWADSHWPWPHCSSHLNPLFRYGACLTVCMTPPENYFRVMSLHAQPWDRIQLRMNLWMNEWMNEDQWLTFLSSSHWFLLILFLKSSPPKSLVSYQD